MGEARNRRSEARYCRRDGQIDTGRSGHGGEAAVTGILQGGPTPAMEGEDKGHGHVRVVCIREVGHEAASVATVIEGLSAKDESMTGDGTAESTEIQESTERNVYLEACT